MTLDALPIKTKAVITKVGGEGELRCRLLDMGLIPKTVVEIRGYTLTIRKEDAAKIEVTEDMP